MCIYVYVFLLCVNIRVRVRILYSLGNVVVRRGVEAGWVFVVPPSHGCCLSREILGGFTRVEEVLRSISRLLKRELRARSVFFFSRDGSPTAKRRLIR